MSSSNTDPVLKLGLEHGGSPDPGLNRYFVGPVCVETRGGMDKLFF